MVASRLGYSLGYSGVRASRPARLPGLPVAPGQPGTQLGEIEVRTAGHDDEPGDAELEVGLREFLRIALGEDLAFDARDVPANLGAVLFQRPDLARQLRAVGERVPDIGVPWLPWTGGLMCSALAPGR
jgi:hypothetical protein